MKNCSGLRANTNAERQEKKINDNDHNENSKITELKEWQEKQAWQKTYDEMRADEAEWERNYNDDEAFEMLERMSSFLTRKQVGFPLPWVVNPGEPVKDFPDWNSGSEK
jgi:hypothetical protein